MKNTAHFFIVFFAIVAILIIGQGVLIPFIFALLFWFLTKEIRNATNKISFIKKYFPKWLNNVFVFLLMILSFGFISEMLTNNIKELTVSINQYKPNIETIIIKLEGYLHIDILKSIKSYFDKFNFANILTAIANSISGVLGNSFMIIIYALFIFLEEDSFKTKLKTIFFKTEQFNKVNSLLLKIEKSISSYLKLKTYVSLLTGGLSFLILYTVGIDSPFFWAFIIFLLNYIPTIGSLIATIFPSIFSLIQFGELSPFLSVLIGVGLVQIVVGNFIEPKVFGKSLNLSPLVTILALSIWGQIWGIVGMLLSVPITVIMMIIFSQVEKTKSIAIMLSENGDIDNNSKTI